MLNGLKRLLGSREWELIYSENPGAAEISNRRNIPRWLRPKVSRLKRVDPDLYYEFKGRRYEYRVSFTANQGHGIEIIRRPR